MIIFPFVVCCSMFLLPCNGGSSPVYPSDRSAGDNPPLCIFHYSGAMWSVLWLWLWSLQGWARFISDLGTGALVCEQQLLNLHILYLLLHTVASSKHLNKYFEKNHMPDLSHICKCLRSYLLNACKVSTQIFGSITWQQLQSTTGVKLLSVTIAALIQWYILAYKLKLASCYKQRHCCKFCGPPCRQPLTRRWETHNAFDSQVAWICHAPDADLSPHARICRTANSDLSQHSPAACHCSQTRWWSGVIMSKCKHMCATLYTELG